MAGKGENIYKRKDGRWEGRYIKSRSSTGKANYGYVYAKSYREVKAKLISQSSCTSNSVTVDPEISSDQFEQVAMETSLDKGTQRKTTENELPSLTQCTA